MKPAPGWSKSRYAIAIPPALAALISDPGDPIGRQFIPDAGELITAPHESPDPIADEALSPVAGIVHRYPDRVLLKPLLACPVYCRFCFRREQVGPSGGLLSDAELQTAYAYIAGQPQIREVILTGGDPLILSPRRLSFILKALSDISHIEILRIHTRAPIADPLLISDALVDALDIEAPLFVALHANHASELTPAVHSALQKLQRRGIPILGQTVLLAGVNDSEAALADLFRAMLRARIKPYYLHQLDPAPGTARFHVPPQRGREILANLRGQISGTALPIYIYDQPGGLGKIPL
jgi:lysine 2,3-aminomutase